MSIGKGQIGAKKKIKRMKEKVAARGTSRAFVRNLVQA